MSTHAGRGRVVGIAFVVLSVCAGSPAGAQTKYPNADSVYPLAVTRGEATELEIRYSGDVATAYKALVEGSGVTANVVRPDGKRKIPKGTAYVKLEVATDAAVGDRDIRLVTEEAVTTLGRFYVTDLPAIREASKHATLETSQPIELPAAVNGRIGANVETDWYRFEAKAGERVGFQVLGTRLHHTIQKIGRFTPHFDAFLSLLDAEGREIAFNDDHFYADSFLSCVIPEDGTYHVVVREANYKGHASYTYVLLATRGAVPALTIPLAAPVGSELPVCLIGPGLGADDVAKVSLPSGTVTGRIVTHRPRLANGAYTREVPILATDLPIVLETENDGEGANDGPADAQIVSLPSGIAGRLESPDAVDCFAFEAKKGARYRFECFARRLFSALDSELQVLDAKGRALASDDDARDVIRHTTRDSALEWTAKADGRYVLRVSDLHSRGGSEFVYHLECERVEPDFELTFDPELAMIGPGNRTPIYVRAHRSGGFDGEIALEVTGLPAGVEAIAPPIRSGMTDACVILSVSEVAGRDGTMFEVRGTARRKLSGGGEEVVVRHARPLVEIYQAQRVIGRTAAVAVTRPSDIAVTTDVREIVLRPGESKAIPIKLIRNERYKSGSVSLWATWKFGSRIFGSSLPPGVSLDDKLSRTGIVGEKVDGVVALKAAPNAKPIQGVQTAVIGLIPIEFSVFVPYCTPPILVTVAGKDDAVALGGTK